MALVACVSGVLRTFLLLTQPPDAIDLWLAQHPAIGVDADDARYGQHMAVTLFHVIPGVLFAVLGPLQFVRRVRIQHSWWHRWSGRLVVLTGMVIAISGLALGFTTALSYAGWAETAPIVVFAPLLLFALLKAVAYIRSGEVAQHREWMIRAFAIGVSAGTVRVISFAVALSHAARQAPRAVIPSLFWAGFLLSLAAGEAWIRYSRTAGERERSFAAMASR
jgi:uncharacterized membrane protein